MENINLPREQELLYKLLIQANNKQTEELKAEFQQNIATLIEKIENNNKEIQELKKRCVYLERKNRKNNVLIFGTQKIPKVDLFKTTVDLIYDLLGIRIKEEEINNIYTVGKSQNPPIVLEFVSFLKKNSLFHDKEKLKNLKQHGITITNDLCFEDREEQKTLRNHLKEARAQNYEATIKNYKLYINNEPYTVEDLKKIEKQTDIDTNSEETIDDTEKKEQKTEGLTPVGATLEPGKINITKKVTIKNQPVVAEGPAKRNNRNNTKTYSYSPKNTRNKKSH